MQGQLLLEPGASSFAPRLANAELALYSQAISMKRIADKLDTITPQALVAFLEQMQDIAPTSLFK